MRLAGEPISDGVLRAAVARCQRDAAELPIRECIERFQAPLWRLDREAKRLFPEAAPARRDLENRILAERLLEIFLRQGQPDEATTAAYLAEHEAEWQSPERLRLFRILVPSREQAEQLLVTLGRGTPDEFRSAARTHSLDRSSHERGGDLGFVAADGTTDLPAVRADPALFAAASAVPDGAFVPKPVPEGEAFAVIWRRGSLPARRLEEAEARAWAQKRQSELAARRQLDQLLARHETERHPDLLARFRRAECRLFGP